VAWRCPADLAALDPLGGPSPSPSIVGAKVSASRDLADDKEEELDTLRDRAGRAPVSSTDSDGRLRVLPLGVPFAATPGPVGDMEGEAICDCVR
jgi:hypothetical protein